MLSSRLFWDDPDSDLHSWPRSWPLAKNSFYSSTAEGASKRKVVTPVDAFRMYRGELLHGIKASSPLILANLLYSQQIISQEALDKCMLSESAGPTLMIMSLMNSIEASIRLDPSAFDQLLTALHDVDRLLSTIADKLRAAVGTKPRPPCCFCGSLDHWFPGVQRFSHREAERALSYLELLDSYTTSQEEKPKEALDTDLEVEDDVNAAPTSSSRVLYGYSVGIINEARDEIQGSKYARESQDDQESHGQQSDRNGDEKGSKEAGGGIPPWMMKEVRDLFQDKASEQAFKQDLKFFQMHKECFVKFIEQLRSQVGKCGVKRDFISAMHCRNMQC